MNDIEKYLFDLKGWIVLPCLFHLYNTVNSRWGAHSVPTEIVATMPEKRQSLFRPVYCARGPQDQNLKYDPEYLTV